MSAVNQHDIEHDKEQVQFYFLRDQFDNEPAEELAEHAIKRTFYCTRLGYETFAKLKDGTVIKVGQAFDSSD
jgi:hypothetical protein